MIIENQQTRKTRSFMTNKIETSEIKPNKVKLNTNTLLYLAILSRISILSFGKLISLFFQRFDLSSSISPLKSSFKFLESWDSFHFINISQNGYLQEHLVAFFPLLPLIVRFLSFILPFKDPLTIAIILNNIFFIISSIVLYKISLSFFNQKFSFISTLFFIFNPASIIYSSFYTESLFTLLFLLALFYSINKKPLRASLLFSLTSFCRSNSIFFVAFQSFVYFPVILFPLCIFQLYALLLICRKNVSFKILVPYSLVQSKYWEQGFLRFLRIRNTPNLLIGLPVISLSLFFLYKFINKNKSKSKSNKTPNKISNKENVSNNILNNNTLNNIVNSKETFIANNESIIIEDNSNEISDGDTNNININDIKEDNPNFQLSFNNNKIITKLAIILGIQTFMLIFLIHWNIALRFIAYNPFLYWSSAYCTLKYYKSKFFNVVVTFFATYGLLYVIMFSCFYPPP